VGVLIKYCGQREHGRARTNGALEVGSVIPESLEVPVNPGEGGCHRTAMTLGKCLERERQLRADWKDSGHSP
jgi:hypothetical protein